MDSLKFDGKIAVLVTLFALLAVAVMTGQTALIDEAGVKALAGYRVADASPSVFENFVAQATHMGDSITLAIMSVIAVTCIYKSGNRLAAGWFLGAAAGSFIITAIAKAVFGRARPDIVEQLVTASSASFPSGHALRSAVVYALIAYLLSNSLFKNQKLAVYAIAMIVIAANGICRVYLGVHWPTDVVGSWLIAAFWLMLCKTGYEFAAAQKRTSGS